MWFFLKQHKFFLTIILFLYLISSGLWALSLLYIGIIIDSLNENLLNQRTIFLNIGIFLLAIILHNTFSFIANQQKIILVNKITVELRNKTIDKIISFPIKNYFENQSGKYISWLNYDVEKIRDNGFNAIFIIFRQCANLTFSLSAIFYINWQIALIIIFINFWIFIIPILLNKKNQKYELTFSKQHEKFTSKLTKLLDGFNTLYFACKLNLFLNLFLKANDEYNKEVIFVAKRWFLLQFACSLTSSIAMGIIYVSTGFFIRDGFISVGLLTSILIFSNNLWLFSDSIYQQALNINSLKHIWKKNFLINKVKKLKNQQNAFKNFVSLNIVNLNFYYRKKNIIKNFNLKIQQGKKYAILGESGTGKSTLLKIILGVLKNYQGSIKLNSVELKNIHDQNLQELISFVDNQNFLFNDSIENNITLWNTPNIQNLNKFKKKANIDEIKDDYEISEFENTLSEGQKQRINLARAFYEEKKVLILDEATANLDKENAIMIEKALLLDKSLTLIMVTHHLKEELMHLYDEIVCL